MYKMHLLSSVLDKSERISFQVYHSTASKHLSQVPSIASDKMQLFTYALLFIIALPVALPTSPNIQMEPGHLFK